MLLLFSRYFVVRLKIFYDDLSDGRFISCSHALKYYWDAWNWYVLFRFVMIHFIWKMVYIDLTVCLQENKIFRVHNTLWALLFSSTFYYSYAVLYARKFNGIIQYPQNMFPTEYNVNNIIFCEQNNRYQSLYITFYGFM